MLYIYFCPFRITLMIDKCSQIIIPVEPYTIGPEVPLQLLASNTSYVMLHSQLSPFSYTYIFNPTTVQLTMFCFSVFHMLVEIRLRLRECVDSLLLLYLPVMTYTEAYMQ